jgi:outer membrane receptor protein involved in Fe transport
VVLKQVVTNVTYSATSPATRFPSADALALLIFAEGNNLTNTQYVEAGFVQMPGRWFKLGLTFGHRAIDNPRP